MKNLIFIALTAILVFSNSCTKIEGGNADMRTVNFTVRSNDWIQFGTPGLAGFGFAVDLSFPEITNNVINNGMVTLYFQTGNSWTPVPVYFFRQDWQAGYFYSMRNGVFSIDYYESDHFTENPGTQFFRLVIVQPR